MRGFHVSRSFFSPESIIVQFFSECSRAFPWDSRDRGFDLRGSSGNEILRHHSLLGSINMQQRYEPGVISAFMPFPKVVVFLALLLMPFDVSIADDRHIDVVLDIDGARDSGCPADVRFTLTIDSYSKITVLRERCTGGRF